MNTQIASPSGASAGVGFAIPVDTINRVVPQLIRTGKYLHPGLGVVMTPDYVPAQLGLRVVWHLLHAFGTPIDTERSGRGTRMLWSCR
jgi:S1-C subfamily serine protease